MKQAKGFSLAELDQSQNTFEVSSQASTPTAEEAIVLDILGDSVAPVSANSNQNKQSSTKIDLYKAYQKVNSKFTFKRGLPLQEKGVFFELLSTMLAAGISVLQAVKVFSVQTKNNYLKTITQAIGYQLEKGDSLSQALQNYRYIFSESEIGMIRSGEVTGRLAEVLKRLSIEATALIELQQKIRSALIYPVIVIVFVIGTLYAMLRFVIPQISQLFATTGIELPVITQWLITSSNFVVGNSTLLIIGFLAILIGIYALSQTYFGKQLFHNLYFKIPVLSEFLKYIYQSRFARSMSNLLNAGVSIVDAVNITARSVSNIVYQKKIDLIGKDVAKGITISESIQDSPYFSNLMSSMISVGEKTAQLDELTKKVAEYYESKTADMADNFTKLIQPFIIAIVGAIVGVIVLAIMLPITELIGGVDTL